ncbi:MAG: MarC family protein [Bacteriovoracaceae bacterium]|nr:MarC family protein [Bacteriovoracaceae bacterium]
MNLTAFKDIFSVTIILFSVIDILGSLPIIIDLRKRPGGIQPMKATFIACIIMVAFLYIGETVLSLFNVDVISFSITGGLIMFLMGLEMVLDIEIFKSNPEVQSSDIVPLAFPLIAGPGTMTTLISLRAEFSQTTVLISVILNILFVYFTLKASGLISKKLGTAGTSVLRKVFGIILLAIAIKLLKNNILA